MIKDVITRLCKEKGISISRLEKELGFSNYAIAKWDKTTPRIDSVMKVANYFGVTLDYLTSSNETELEYSPESRGFIEKRVADSTRRIGDNDKTLILQELSAILKNYGGEVSSETRKIPIVSTIKCGPNGIAYEDIDAYLMVDETLHGDLFVLRAKGDSMQGKGIFDGDLAIIRRQEILENGEIGAFLIDGEEATLKRYVVIPNGVALEAANPLYETRYFSDVDKNRLYIIGKLVEIRKRF